LAGIFVLGLASGRVKSELARIGSFSRKPPHRHSSAHDKSRERYMTDVNDAFAGFQKRVYSAPWNDRIT
jgi:hypothetical protein